MGIVGASDGVGWHPIRGGHGYRDHGMALQVRQ